MTPSGARVLEGLGDGRGGGAGEQFDEDVVAPAVLDALDGAGDGAKGVELVGAGHEAGGGVADGGDHGVAVLAARDHVHQAAERGVARLVPLRAEIFVVAHEIMTPGVLDGGVVGG